MDFMLRLLAFTIDVAILSPVASSIKDVVARLNPFQSLVSYFQFPVFGYVLVIIPALGIIYSTLMELSTFRATVGKILVGFIVCRKHLKSKNASRMFLLQAIWRNSLKWLSFQIPFVYIAGGYLLIRKGFLHEALSHTKTFTRPIDRFKFGRDVLREDIYTPEPHFEDHEAAGLHGEQLLLKDLERMMRKNRGIFDFGTTGNLVFRNYNFEIDAYALVPHVGIVIMEAKYYSGHLHTSDSDRWSRITFDGIDKPVSNPCRQAARTADLFVDLLESRQLNRWPVYSMVVLTHPNAYVDTWGHRDGWVVHLDRLEDEFKLEVKAAGKNEITFTAKDASDIKKLLAKHEKAFQPRQSDERPVI